jgi:hypothetical protein
MKTRQPIGIRVDMCTRLTCTDNQITDLDSDSGSNSVSAITLEGSDIVCNNNIAEDLTTTGGAGTYQRQPHDQQQRPLECEVRHPGQ